MSTRLIKLTWRILFTFVVALVGHTGFCGPGQDTRQAAESNNGFAVGLFRQLTNQSGNLVISPFSAGTGLAMVYAGACGQTARQIARALHFSSGDSELQSDRDLLTELTRPAFGIQMNTANSLWVQSGFRIKQAFKEALHLDFSAELYTADLTGWPGTFDPEKAAMARKRMDEWVADRTHSKVLNAIPTTVPSPATRMVMLNTVYFKGIWQTPFDTSLTKNLPFYLSGTNSISVPFMHRDAYFSYSANTSVRALEIPYSSNHFSMVILLPTGPGGLGQLQRNFTVRLVDSLHESATLRQFALFLPKFNVASEVTLKGPFQKMGIRDAFEDGADFSNISAVKPLFIDTVLHKACVAVDEKGTTAAASTMVHLVNGRIELFAIDHPFIFLIRDNSTGAILFIGRIINPLENL